MWKVIQHNLENARALAELDKRRPREGSLRRAVSTAYYALFQALCETCANSLVGWNRPWEVYTPIFRAVDHVRAAQVLRDSSFATTPALERLGHAFKELKAAREWADYNPEPSPSFVEGAEVAPFTRDATLAYVAMAEEAIEILTTLDEDTRLKLAIRLVTKSRK